MGVGEIGEGDAVPVGVRDPVPAGVTEIADVRDGVPPGVPELDGVPAREAPAARDGMTDADMEYELVGVVVRVLGGDTVTPGVLDGVAKGAYVTAPGSYGST